MINIHRHNRCYSLSQPPLNGPNGPTHRSEGDSGPASGGGSVLALSLFPLFVVFTPSQLHTMNNAVMRAAMTCIGFTEAAAQALVEEQGIDSLEEVKLLTDDEIESLCRVIRRPGGNLPPVAGALPGAVPVPNPGVPVNQRAEGHLKLLAFYLRHQARVSRNVTVPDITLEAIRSVRELREFESTYKKPDDLPTINAKDWPKTMEAIDEHLRSVLGERKIPLAYVVRKDEGVAADGITYPTIQDEMIARAPHYTISEAGVRTYDPIYLANREKVWEIISRITREHSSWTYVKPAQRTRDGRMAYNGLYQHYLGPNNVDNMATMAEDKLKTTVYNGEQRRWDFEKRQRPQTTAFHYGRPGGARIHGYRPEVQGTLPTGRHQDGKV
jgi:ribosomal protein S13